MASKAWPQPPMVYVRQPLSMVKGTTNSGPGVEGNCCTGNIMDVHVRGIQLFFQGCRDGVGGYARGVGGGGSLGVCFGGAAHRCKESRPGL